MVVNDKAIKYLITQDCDSHFNAQNENKLLSKSISNHSDTTHKMKKKDGLL